MVPSHLTLGSRIIKALFIFSNFFVSRHAYCSFRWSLFLLCFFILSTVANAEISFIPHISTGVSYTDNVNLDPFDEEYDVLTFANPGVDLSLSGRNGALLISYNPTYTAYTRFPEYNSWSHSAMLDGWAEIARNTRIELTNTYLCTEDPISDTDTTVRRGRQPYDTNTAIVGIINRFGDEDEVDLRYEYYILENDDATIEDSSYHRPILSMTYWFIPNRYAVEMDGSYTISDYDVSEDFEELDARVRLIKRFGRHFDGYIEYGHSYTNYLDDGIDYRVYSPLAGFIWAEQADTQFSASFGYFYRDNEGGGDDDGIVGSVEMIYDWTAVSTISFNGNVGYDRADFGAENLGFNPYYEVTGSITHQLSRRIAGNLLAGYRRNLYIDEDPDRDDTIWRAGAGLVYRALPWLSFSLDYLYRQLDSNVNVNDYTENRGTLSVTLTPRQPVRF